MMIQHIAHRLFFLGVTFSSDFLNKPLIDEEYPHIWWYVCLLKSSEWHYYHQFSGYDSSWLQASLPLGNMD